MIKYLEKTQIDCEPTSIVEPVATDNYNETKILEKVKTKNVNQCFAVALQFSIAGMGNRNYGKAVIDGVIFDVLQIMKENDIHFNSADLATRKTEWAMPEASKPAWILTSSEALHAVLELRPALRHAALVLVFIRARVLRAAVVHLHGDLPVGPGPRVHPLGHR